MNYLAKAPVFKLVFIILCLVRFASKAQSPRESILYEPDRSAQFPGGVSGLYTFLNKTIYYPQSALSNKYSQKVGVQMTIDKNGTITDIITPPNLRKDFDDEVHRLIALMPKWLPASKNDQLIESTVFFFVNFIPPK